MWQHMDILRGSFCKCMYKYFWGFLDYSLSENMPLMERIEVKANPNSKAKKTSMMWRSGCGLWKVTQNDPSLILMYNNPFFLLMYIIYIMYQEWPWWLGLLWSCLSTASHHTFSIHPAKISSLYWILFHDIIILVEMTTWCHDQAYDSKIACVVHELR